MSAGSDRGGRGSRFSHCDQRKSKAKNSQSVVFVCVCVWFEF